MAAWSVAPGAKQTGGKEHMIPPPGASSESLEQFRTAQRAADLIIQSKTIGTGATFTVALSGVANAGHPNGDSITVTVTNAN